MLFRTWMFRTVFTQLFMRLSRTSATAALAALPPVTGHVHRPRRFTAKAAANVLGAVLVVAVIRSAAGQPTIFETPLSERVVHYTIKARLDDQTKHLDGDLTLVWNNPSNDRVGELQFHLYTNAFRNTRSTAGREMLHGKAVSSSRSLAKEVEWEEDDGWGGMNITRMEVDGLDVTDRITFFQPDDGNADDRTVIRVPLVDPVGPRAPATIHIVFESRIPQCHMRTGWWQDDFFMMAHWFPKIGVYEGPGTRFVPRDAAHGQWNCHQFHAATEFYSDFGVFDVEITLPQRYVVGTTGLIVERRGNDDGSQTIRAHAEDVHEFAWVADAQFREASDLWRSPQSGQEVKIRLLYQPDHGGVVHKYLGAVKDTLDHVDQWLGPAAYPYPNITVADPRAGSGAGGMEYPNLITGGAYWWVEQLFGEGAKPVELVTIHEFMHQFWYGIVGSNEFEEAWLDEGLTTYSEQRISASLFGADRSLLNWWGVHAGSALFSRLGYTRSRSKNDGAIADPTFAHWYLWIGPNLAYNKSSLMLVTLENYLGRERFDAVMRTYFQRWKFRHPCREDFVAVVHEVVGEDLDWFFDQVLRGNSSLDYAVAAIANVPVEAHEKGILGDELGRHEKKEHQGEGDEERNGDDDDDDDGLYQSTVVFRRNGDLVFPVETLIEFADGRVVRETWDGRERVKAYRFDDSPKVVRAAVDPDRRVPLDVDYLNNSVRVEENRFVTDKYTLKGFFWMQNFLQFLSILG